MLFLYLNKDTLKKCKEILESGKWVKTEKKWTAKEVFKNLKI